MPGAQFTRPVSREGVNTELIPTQEFSFTTLERLLERLHVGLMTGRPRKHMGGGGPYC